MRLNFRFIFSLVIIVGCISALVSWFQVRAEQQRMQADLRVRSQVLAESLQESIQPQLENRSRNNVQRIVERFGHREHLIGIAVYDRTEALQAISSSLASKFSSASFSPGSITAESQKKNRSEEHTSELQSRQY